MRNSMRFLFAGALASLWLTPAIAALPASCASEEDFTKAIPACTVVIDSAKTSKDDLVAALRMRAKHQIAMSDKDAAKEDVDKALQLRPSDATLYALRAETYGEYDTASAIADMDKAIELSPKDAGYRIQRAKLYVADSDYRAEEEFGEAIRLEPKKAEWFSARYEYYLDRHEYDKALPDVSQMVSLGKTDSLVWRAQVLMYLGRFDEATSDLSKYTDSDASKAEGKAIMRAIAYGMQGFCRMVKGQHDKAVSDYSKAITAFDDNTLRELRGNAFVSMKQYDIAIQDYTHVLKQKPDNVALLYLRSIAHDLNGQPKLALADRTDAAFYSSGLKRIKKN